MPRIESSLQFKLRMMYSGRYDEFCKERRALEATGVSQGDSYRIKAQEFGRLNYHPQVIVKEEEGNVEDKAVQIRRAGFSKPIPEDRYKSVRSLENISKDFRWVYENIGRKAVKKKDAPSDGAFELLGWARDNRDFYYNKMFTLSKQHEDVKLRSERKSKVDDEDDGSEQLEMLAKALKET